MLDIPYGVDWKVKELEGKIRTHARTLTRKSDFMKMAAQEWAGADYGMTRWVLSNRTYHYPKEWQDERDTIRKSWEVIWHESKKVKQEEIKARAEKLKDRYFKWAYSTLNSHKQKGFDIQIKPDDLANRARTAHLCPLCGTSLAWVRVEGRRYASPNSPTLDRINNEKHLNLENTKIICYQCNRAKGPLTETEFFVWVRRVAAACA